ncbi:MAG: Imm49 family immunity protein [Granulosicoccus sp.]
MNYNDSADALAYDAAFWAMAFEDENYDLAALGDISLELGRKLRAIGILGLMATGDNSHLHDNLRRSGDYRVQYLQRVFKAKRDDQHHYVWGRLNPVFDIVASGDNAQIASIAQYSPGEFYTNREYLPDYCYANLLSTFSLGPSHAIENDELRISSMLEQYEQWLDGETDPRFEICSAIALSDEAGFLDAFDMLLAQRVDSIEERRSTDLEDILIATERLIFVEGLALLRIARQRSFNVDEDFIMCPRSARLAPGAN